MKTIDNFNFNQKTVLIRVDFNVPLDADFQVTDTNRIEAAKPTILKVIKEGGKAVLMSHLGRPKGEKNSAYSLKHIVASAEKILGVPVVFIEDCIGNQVKHTIDSAVAGSVILLENLRFYAEEE